MVIIDFDDTLFDTQAFKQARLEAVQRLGVSEEEYWETYRQARSGSGGFMTYSDERHAEMLTARGYNYCEILATLQETTGDAVKNFLFEDTVLFLKNIKAINQPMVLLSLGNPGFQELKTKGSGIDKYFDRMFFVHDTKMHVLAEFFKKVTADGVWFINDKIEETQKLKKTFPKLKPILKVSERFEISEYKESGFPYFDFLEDIGKYIKKS
ncbi:MAG: HAD family hydrolase [Patescibacteria group bacterium]